MKNEVRELARKTYDECGRDTEATREALMAYLDKPKWLRLFGELGIQHAMSDAMSDARRDAWERGSDKGDVIVRPPGPLPLPKPSTIGDLKLEGAAGFVRLSILMAEPLATTQRPIFYCTFDEVAEDEKWYANKEAAYGRKREYRRLICGMKPPKGGKLLIGETLKTADLDRLRRKAKLSMQEFTAA